MDKELKADGDPGEGTASQGPVWEEDVHWKG